MTLRAAIYARFSTDMQRDASIDDQVRVCRMRAERKGWTVTQVYADYALSGATTNRPQLQAMVADARLSRFDIVIAEALDRLSRDQEDIAALYKRLKFAGVRIITLAEGEISELHVGLKGTMNALFIKDLAAKTHRGLRGRVEAGRSGGGNAYGYRVVRRISQDGQPVVGEREIDPSEARVVERVFREYSAGLSPRQIAINLNADGIAAPRTKSWTASTINGNRARGTGILNNELYVGRLAWNRLTYMKDPDTGRRRSRARAAEDLVVKDVPHLRIVTDELWGAARARQGRLDGHKPARSADAASGAAHAPFWSKQRPRYLFSGLVRCGVCGGGFSMIGVKLMGCSTARNKGPTACGNRLTIRRRDVESAVLDGLSHRIMDPELFKVFVEQFTAEWNRLQAEAGADRDAWQSELDRIRHKIERLVDAIASGAPPASVNARLRELENRSKELELLISGTEAPAPRLHPNLGEVYRQTVSSLLEVLARDDSAEARDVVRGLIEAITLIPEDGKLRVEIRGELASILALSASGRTAPSAVSAEAVAQQVKMVAGIGFEPMTFRL